MSKELFDLMKQAEALTPDEQLQLIAHLTGLKQISRPNKAQSSFISSENVAIMVQPLDKAERHCCAKSL